jgi:hypothetical protein
MRQFLQNESAAHRSPRHLRRGRWLATWTLVVVLALGILGSSRAASALCGDGVVDADEDCDQGGTCIGGPSAGTACHVGDATCTDGTCTTFGGNGCAANCTTEHDVLFELVPGEVPPGASQPAPGTSGVAIASILNISLPLSAPAQQTLTVGKLKDGKIPVVVKASSVHYPAVPVQILIYSACGCIRGVSAKTCGGTLFEAGGTTLSTDCTPGYSSCTTEACDTAGEPCAGKAPCAFVNGEGNTAAGEIGCDGLDGTDILFEEDAATGGPAVVTVSGHGGPGSANIAQTLGLGALLGPCTGSSADYGADGQFCTDDDPATGLLRVAQTLPSVTGTAMAVVHNTRGTSNDLGPVTTTGAPFSCSDLENGDQSSAGGAGLVGAFAIIGVDLVGDIAVTAQLFAAAAATPTPTLTPTPTTTATWTPTNTGTLSPTHTATQTPINTPTATVTGTPAPSATASATAMPTASSTPTVPPPMVCAGDCGSDGVVTVDEIITLVNIILGSANSSACPDGIPADGAVDVTLAIRAVNNALSECPAA